MNKQSKQPSEAVPPIGLVVSYFGNSVAVEDASGQVFPCHLHRNQALPVVGDRVHFQVEQNQTGIVLEILPRGRVLARGDARGGMKLIAANVDTIVVVMAPPPVFSALLVDRYFIAAHLLHLSPVLVVNKMDLLDLSEREQLEKSLQRYQDISFPVVLTSAKTGEGLDALNAYLKDNVSVFVGPSGVGKSSLITHFTGQTITVCEVSSKGAGKHTTTATRLYHLPNGGQLIDSPGVRDFNLWKVSEAEVLAGFTEFQPFIHNCKFRNCTHLVEPGCAVQKAVTDGKISTKRFANYQLLMKEARSHKNK